MSNISKFELRSLRQFVVLAQELHYGRAATRLHMSQPPLTQAIQKLEANLGVSLFDRTQRTVRLSLAGASLLPVVKRILADAEGLPAIAQAAAAGLQGRLRLAFVSTVGFGAMPSWLQRFRLKHAGIALALREATLDVQLSLFDAQEVDAGFVVHSAGQAVPGFESLMVGREPMVLAVGGADCAQRAKRMTLTQALSQPLVIFPRAVAPSLHDAILAFYQSQQALPQIVQEANQMQTIVNLVSGGMGVAWVPAALTALQRVDVVYKRFRAAVPVVETRLIWRPDASAVVQRFVEHVHGETRCSAGYG